MNLHLITGGSRGLGLALCQFFAERGDDVVEISRSGSAEHPRIRSFPCDLTSGDSKALLLEKIFANFPTQGYRRITLINNAGMVEPIRHIADLQEVEIARNLAVNLVAPMALTAAFLKETAAFSGERVVVNISSGVAKQPKGSWAAYSAAKAGLESFSEALAKDLAGDAGAKVIAFTPGILDTDMQARIRQTAKSDFAEVDKFLGFKASGELLAPELVAAKLGRLLLREDLVKFTSVSVDELT